MLPEDDEIVMETRGIVGVWEQRLKEEGLQKGEKKCLLATYKARFGAVPAKVRAAVEGTQVDATLESWIELFMFKSAAEIAAALRRR